MVHISPGTTEFRANLQFARHTWRNRTSNLLIKSFFHHIDFIGFNGLRASSFLNFSALFRILFDNKPATTCWVSAERQVARNGNDIATIRLFAVIRQTMNGPVVSCPQKWVNPRNVKICGFPLPQHFSRS